MILRYVLKRYSQLGSHIPHFFRIYILNEGDRWSVDKTEEAVVYYVDSHRTSRQRMLPPYTGEGMVENLN
jgi:hypothetical protein